MKYTEEQIDKMIHELRQHSEKQMVLKAVKDLGLNNINKALVEMVEKNKHLQPGGWWA